MNTLSERLKSARNELGVSQEKLVNMAGLKNQSIIGSLESGYRKDSTYIPRIADALGINALWLSTGKGEKYKNKKIPEGAKTYIVSDPKKQAIIEILLGMKEENIDDLKSGGFDNDVQESDPKSADADTVKKSNEQ